MAVMTYTSAYRLLDELIKLHRSMVETSQGASSALGRATNEANAALTQLQSEFALAKRGFQDQLLQEMESSTKRTQSSFERMIKGMDTAIQGAMGQVLSRIKDFNSETISLGHVCQS